MIGRMTSVVAVAALMMVSPAFAGGPEVNFDQPGGGLAPMIEYAKQEFSAPRLPAAIRAQGDDKKETPAEKEKGLGGGFLRISELLKGASPAAKEEFLDSLVLIDGKVVSVTVKMLAQDVGEERTRQILLAVFPSTGKLPNASKSVHASGLCNENYCYNAVCTGTSTEHWCMDWKNGTCGSSC